MWRADTREATCTPSAPSPIRDKARNGRICRFRALPCDTQQEEVRRDGPRTRPALLVKHHRCTTPVAGGAPRIQKERATSNPALAQLR
jgi:hypothetical protein